MSLLLAAGLAGAATALAVPRGSARRLLSAGAPLHTSRTGRHPPWTLRLAHPRTSRRARRRTAAAAADVAVALDLLSVCLSAGVGPAAALAVVARGVPGALGDDLASVATAIDLGASAEQAWSAVLPGSPAALQQTAQRFVHAEHSGAALAPALVAIAADHRRVVHLARARAARRVGVLAVLPLAFCFLPAFVLAGVLPVVAGLLAGMPIS